jgi:hypothetical protein
MDHFTYRALRHAFPRNNSVHSVTTSSGADGFYPSWVKVKVKQSRYWPEQAQSVDRRIALPFRDFSTRGVCGQHHALAALPPEKTRYPLYRRLGGPQDRSERVRKISSPPGFDPRTVQPVASCYTD